MWVRAQRVDQLMTSFAEVRAQQTPAALEREHLLAAVRRVLNVELVAFASIDACVGTHEGRRGQDFWHGELFDDAEWEPAATARALGPSGRATVYHLRRSTALGVARARWAPALDDEELALLSIAHAEVARLAATPTRILSQNHVRDLAPCEAQAPRAPRSSSASLPTTPCGAIRLSRREQEVFRCLLEGLHDKEIAERLGISSHTVNGYTKRIYRAHGVRSRLELLASAIRVQP